MAATDDRDAAVKAAIEEHLSVPDGRKALKEAQDELSFVLKHLAGESPADAALIHAQLAGYVAGTTARLRRLTLRGGRVPDSAHLVQVFEENRAKARRGNR